MQTFNIIKKSDIDKKNSVVVDKYDHRVITLAFENRELLYNRIETRVDQMIGEGLVEETRRLMAEGVFERSLTAAQANWDTSPWNPVRPSPAPAASAAVWSSTLLPTASSVWPGKC